jgi:hypothetical protein
MVSKRPFEQDSTGEALLHVLFEKRGFVVGKQLTFEQYLASQTRPIYPKGKGIQVSLTSAKLLSGFRRISVPSEVTLKK